MSNLLRAIYAVYRVERRNDEMRSTTSAADDLPACCHAVDFLSDDYRLRGSSAVSHQTQRLRFAVGRRTTGRRRAMPVYDGPSRPAWRTRRTRQVVAFWTFRNNASFLNVMLVCFKSRHRHINLQLK